VTDPTPTGYGETGEEESPTPSAEQETTLTTDDEAQREDPAIRPGNQSD
jgi:hypothetical protein